VDGGGSLTASVTGIPVSVPAGGTFGSSAGRIAVGGSTSPGELSEGGTTSSLTCGVASSEEGTGVPSASGVLPDSVPASAVLPDSVPASAVLPDSVPASAVASPSPVDVSWVGVHVSPSQVSGATTLDDSIVDDSARPVAAKTRASTNVAARTASLAQADPAPALGPAEMVRPVLLGIIRRTSFAPCRNLIRTREYSASRAVAV
jgi:hypothetical protein